MRNILSILFLTKTLAIDYVHESWSTTWSTAETYCINRYNTHLATIEDADSAQALLDVATDADVQVWMGLNDIDTEGTWVYADGTVCPGTDGNCNTLDYWSSNEPSNSGDEDCGMVYIHNTIYNMLNDIGCSSLMTFVCNKPEPQYVGVSELLTWENAQTYCEETYDSNLATIYDDDSAQQILDIRDAEGFGATWIGLNDKDTEGSYEWVDGTLCPSEYGDVCTPASGYPYWHDTNGGDNAGGSEHCVHVTAVATNVSVMLNDISCSQTFNFICNYHSNGTNASALSCPSGSIQIGEAGADIAGCGLEACADRYENDYLTIESCKEGCNSNVDCVSFSWAPFEGDANHPDQTVCTLYDSLEQTQTWGETQILCELELCDAGPSSFIWEDLMKNDSYTKKPDVVATLSVNESSLSLNIEIVADYLGYSAADDNGYVYGTTYVIDFEDFDAHEDNIKEPGICQNRREFDPLLTWEQVWLYSETPNVEGHIASSGSAYHAYASGNKWTLEMSEDDPCDIIYSTTLTWSELTQCTGYEGANGLYITTEDNAQNLTLSGTLYINVVSPYDYAADYGYYRVYQLLSQPFMIVVSKTTYVLGDVGINLFTMDIIAVYKEDAENTFRLIVLTESAEYLRLSRDDLGLTTSYFDVFVASDETNPVTSDDFAMLEEAETVNDCLTNKEYICSQLWQITAENVECTEGGIFTDFSGTYMIQFTPLCRNATNLPGDNTEDQEDLKTYCDEWLVDHLDEISDSTATDKVLLSAELSWKDEICDPEIFKVQFEASMEFYTDSDFSNQVLDPSTGHLFQVGEDTIYVKITTDYPTNTFSVFGTELLNVWICTFDPLSPPDDITVDSQAGGCFSNHTDDNSFIGHIYEAGVKELEDFVLDTTTTTLASNEIQFQFLVPDKVVRDTLYIHAQIEVSLSNGRRRRMLLKAAAQQANQIEHFVDRVSIRSAPQHKPQAPIHHHPHPQQPIEAPPQAPIAPPSQPWIISLQSPLIIALCGFLAVVLAINIIFMCYTNCIRSNDGAIISFGRRSKYKRVVAMDSDEASEHDAINVVSN